MNEYESWEIGGHWLEYYDTSHIYLVDGLVVPSITTIIKGKFREKYDGISKATLNHAADLGTAVHEAIERFCKDGTESELPELRNFKFLKNQYQFEVIDNEVPVILFQDDKPISAGRLDMVIKMAIADEKGNSYPPVIGLADIKRTSKLDKEYLAYQLNLYRIAYWQSYGVKARFLKGIHLREDTRKFVNIPINEDLAWDIVTHWRKEHGDI